VLLVHRLTCDPQEAEFYRFRGTGTLGPIVADLLPQNLASPTGNVPSTVHASVPMFEPAIVGTFGKAA
jgi:hypothetical protein